MEMNQVAIKVLIIDDSATARAAIKEILESDRDIEVVGSAPDAFVARDRIVELKPDVICLDVEMPRMDGITFLKKLMQYMPTPVIMVSSLTQKGAQTTLDALEAGAIDFVGKPHSNIYDGKNEIKSELIAKVKMASRVRVGKILLDASSNTRLVYKPLSETTDKVIDIGASTGGTEALKDLLVKLPANTPGIIIVQHMPANFTKAFAERLLPKKPQPPVIRIFIIPLPPLSFLSPLRKWGLTPVLLKSVFAGKYRQLKSSSHLLYKEVLQPVRISPHEVHGQLDQIYESL